MRAQILFGHPDVPAPNDVASLLRSDEDIAGTDVFVLDLELDIIAVDKEIRRALQQNPVILVFDILPDNDDTGRCSVIVLQPRIHDRLIVVADEIAEIVIACFRGCRSIRLLVRRTVPDGVAIYQRELVFARAGDDIAVGRFLDGFRSVDGADGIDRVFGQVEVAVSRIGSGGRKRTARLHHSDGGLFGIVILARCGLVIEVVAKDIGGIDFTHAGETAAAGGVGDGELGAIRLPAGRLGIGPGSAGARGVLHFPFYRFGHGAFRTVTLHRKVIAQRSEMAIERNIRDILDIIRPILAYARCTDADMILLGAQEDHISAVVLQLQLLRKGLSAARALDRDVQTGNVVRDGQHGKRHTFSGIDGNDRAGGGEFDGDRVGHAMLPGQGGLRDGRDAAVIKTHQDLHMTRQGAEFRTESDAVDVDGLTLVVADREFEGGHCRVELQVHRLAALRLKVGPHIGVAHVGLIDRIARIGGRALGHPLRRRD